MEIEISQSMVASKGFKYFILPQTSLAKEAKKHGLRNPNGGRAGPRQF
jgi:hypothetical protein